MTLSIPETLPTALKAFGAAYVCVEITFYFVFHYIFVPRVNKWVHPAAYRDYGKNRHQVLLRILNRATKHTTTREDARSAIEAYVRSCFDPVVDGERVLTSPVSRQPRLNPGLLQQQQKSLRCDDDDDDVASVDSTTATSRLSSSDDDEHSYNSSFAVDSDKDEHFTVDGFGRQDIEALFGWAFFGKNLHQLEDWEVVELAKCFDVAEEHYGLVFPEGSKGLYQARCLSLEDCDPMHRPLFVYIAVYFMKFALGVILRLVGYQRVVSKEGVVGWYRPARESAQHLLPLLFFHGLAPGGIFLYLPILLLGFLYDGRASFLFENPNITCKIGFHALTEDESVAGTAEIVNRFLSPNQKVSVCGHSFGSVPLTWLVQSKQFRSRIAQFTLLDPVTILLSEPTVMVNFLYRKNISMIRTVAGSELFTEYYLRRHFAFFNSELWLDDLPIKPLVVLSGKDEILNAPGVRNHIVQEGIDADIIFWEKAAHGHLVVFPSKWREIKTAMLRQELQLMQQQ